jgi:hypothetical protein
MSGQARGVDLLRFGLVVGLLALLLGTAGAAADRQGDFVHLWLGGQRAASGAGAALYAAEGQRRALAEALGTAVPASLWAPRNDVLGAFFYPPPAALLYAPLGALHLRLAGVAHAVLHAIAALLSGLVLARWAGLRPTAGALLVLSCPAVLHGHVLGQNGVWTLLLISLALELLRAGRPLLGGLGLGLLVAKPHWLLLLAPVALVAQAPRLALGAALGAGGLSALSLLIFGAAPWADYLGLLPALGRLSEQPGAPLHLQYGLPAAVLRWIGPEGGAAARALALAVLGLGAAAAARRGGRAGQALAVVGAGLASPHLHPYDLVVALPGLALLCARAGWMGLGLVVLHHLLLSAEGGAGSGLVLPPATVALGLVALALAPRGPAWAYRFLRRPPLPSGAGSGLTGGVAGLSVPSASAPRS